MKVIDLYKAGLIISGTDGDEEVINGKEDGGELFFINKVFYRSKKVRDKLFFKKLIMNFSSRIKNL